MKLRIRRLEESDLPTRIQLLNDPMVSTVMAVDWPLSLGDSRAWFSRNELNASRRDFCFCDANAGSLNESIVAMCGLVDIDYFHRRAELYIMVKPAVWGHGIGLAALHWLCNYGFGHLNLYKIYLYVSEHNEKAIRLYKRAGFVEEGCLREHHLHYGRWINRYIFGLLRKEWERASWQVQPPVPMEVEIL